jgi:hypothetical protein
MRGTDCGQADYAAEWLSGRDSLSWRDRDGLKLLQWGGELPIGWPMPAARAQSSQRK